MSLPGAHEPNPDYLDVDQVDVETGRMYYTGNGAAPGIGRALLADEIDRQRARREARRILDAEERPPAEMPEVLTLRERLARPRAPLTYRIDGWQPTGGRVILAAQYKAGKTTLTGNLVRSLADGDDFLGSSTVALPGGTVAVLDFEMSANQLDQWLADQRITHDERVVVLPMRGNAAAFDILDPARRIRWVELLATRGVAYVVLDCLRAVLDALGLDEHRDAGRFLVAFDALLTEAGVDEACLVHHMGHNGERSRGDSRIRDWPDVEWRLVREDVDDPSSLRYLSAFGRDVEQPEQRLDYNTLNRHLSLAGGSRRDAKADRALADVLRVVAEEPGLSGRKLEDHDALVDHKREAIRAALKSGQRDGKLRVVPGVRRAKLYHPSAPVRGSAPPVRQRSGDECASAPIEGALTAHADIKASAPCLDCGAHRPTNPNTHRCADCTNREDTDR